MARLAAVRDTSSSSYSRCSSPLPRRPSPLLLQQPPDPHAGMNMQMPTDIDAWTWNTPWIRRAHFLMGESSGTGFQPSAWPMPMLMTSTGNWNLMWMAQAFVVDTQQTGPLGRRQVLLHELGHAQRAASPRRRRRHAAHHAQPGARHHQRRILSPALPDRRDRVRQAHRQWPASARLRDGAERAIRPQARRARAVGPVLRPGRRSRAGAGGLSPSRFGMEIPQATLGHHWEDSTHILYNVVTAGLSFKSVRLEASGFHGAEPGENRWNIQYGAMNSYSGRVRLRPPRDGRRRSQPDISPIPRRWSRAMSCAPPRRWNTWCRGRTAIAFATSFVWGRNWKTAGKYGSNAVLAETVVPFKEKNFVTARYEWSQRDELFADNPALAQHLVRANRQPLVRRQRLHLWDTRATSASSGMWRLGWERT